MKNLAVPDQRSNKGTLLYPTLKFAVAPLVRFAYRVDVEGLEHFPLTGPVIVAANHLSFLDSVVIPSCLPRRIVYLAKAEYFASWKTAWFFKGLGMIPVERTSRGQAKAVLEAAARVLEKGSVLGLYPEGTRSSDGRLYRGRTGVARLVIRSGASVVPVGIQGTQDVMPKKARLPKPTGHVKLRFGRPHGFESYLGQPENGPAVRAITDEIMEAIMNLSGQEYVDEYASVDNRSAEDFRVPVDEMLG